MSFLEAVSRDETHRKTYKRIIKMEMIFRCKKIGRQASTTDMKGMKYTHSFDKNSLIRNCRLNFSKFKRCAIWIEQTDKFLQLAAFCSVLNG